MIKRHSITGLLYFCKTCKNIEPKKYLGSGIYWKNHLRIHGKHVETVWLKLFDNRDDLIEFSTFFSEFHNIVYAKDTNGNKIWANLEIENGISGMPLGTDRGEEFKNSSRCVLSRKGIDHPSYGCKWWNNGITEVKTKIKPDGDNWITGRLGLADKINKTKQKNGTHPSGNKNGRFDNRIHKFINKITGEVVISTQFDFRTSKQLERRPVNKLVDGTSKTYRRWICIKE